jgi:hypothetical protein
MAKIGFPPKPVYPTGLDSDRTLYLVHNTAETHLAADNQPWAETVEIVPVAADVNDLWGPNGFANIDGELFYYDDVEKDANGKVSKLLRCARNLGGERTKFNAAGSWVRGFVIAEHHNQLAEAIIALELFIGEISSEDPETLDYRIRQLESEPDCIDDYNCVVATIDMETVDTTNTNCVGTPISYTVNVLGSFNEYRLDFGDGTYTSDLTGVHVYSPNTTVDPVLTVANELCQIIQTPDRRSQISTVPSIPPPDVPSIPICSIPDIPPFTVPSCQTPSVTFTFPPFGLPCISIPEITLPSVLIDVATDLFDGMPSVIAFDNVPDIPSVIMFDNLPEMPSVVTFDNIPEFPSIILFGDIPEIPSVIAFENLPEFPSMVVFENLPEFPSVVVFENVPEFPSVVVFENIPDFPSVVIFENIPEFPSMVVFEHIPDFPSIVVFDNIPDFPSAVIFANVPELPSMIDFGSIPEIPSLITFVSIPSFPSLISVIVPEIPNISLIVPDINIPPVNVNVNVNVNVPDIPDIMVLIPDIPDITVMIPDIPDIQVIVPDIPDININGSIPTSIQINGNIPTSINLNGNIPSSIEITGNIPTSIQVTGDIPTSINITGNIPSSIQLEAGEITIPPVEFGTPPTITCSCTVTVSCGGGSSGMRAPTPPTDDFEDGFDMMAELDVGDIGIPSEIKILPPEFPDVRIRHDLPREILLRSPDLPDIIRIIGPETPIPTEIKIIGTDVPKEIELVARNIPTAIALDVRALPTTITVDGSSLPTIIKLETLNPIPSVISIDYSGMPDTIMVEGIPKTIELKGQIPSEIVLKVPENIEVPLVYKSGPIPLQFDMVGFTGENKDAPCFVIAPCPKK